MIRKAFPALLLISFVLIGLFLRLRWWPNYLSFGFEQANDAISSANIYLQKNITLLGPMSEVRGIFHSPIYYYIIGAVYFLFGKNPAWVSLFIILSNLSCIPLIYLVGRKMFNSKVGLIAAFIFTFSYEAISYSLWIANASLGLPFIILFFYFLYRSVKENQKYLPLTFLFFSLATTFELIISLNIFAIASIIFIYNKEKIKTKTIFLSALGFILPLITYPIFEIRNNFLMTKSVLGMFGGQDSELKSIFQYLFSYADGLAKEFANVLFPINGFIAGIIMIFLLVFLFWKLKKDKINNNPWKFILIWIMATLPAFFFSASVTNSGYVFIGANTAIILLSAYLIYELFVKRKRALSIFFVFILLLANLRAWSSYLSNSQRKLFDSQRGVILKDTLGVVDYTYANSAGKPFFVHTITVPLYVSKLWDYLYSWQGNQIKGYPSLDRNTPLQYLIIEQGFGQNYEYFKQQAIDELNQTTIVEETKQFGKITVERRLLKKK